MHMAQHPQAPAQAAKRSTRISELDYMKGIMILLMISFHLVYIGDTYPNAKLFVYTFHMPTFLLISGYLMNCGKPIKDFIATMLWFTVPYVVMESGYVLMASLLPIREHIENLSLQVFLERLLIHPLGPYWYLHMLILCGTTYYAVYHVMRQSLLSKIIMIGIMFALYAKAGVLSLSMSFYFLGGIIIRHSSFSFLQIFRPSFLSLVAILMLIIHPANLHSDSCGGVLIVYLVISICLTLYPYLNPSFCRTMEFIGRNTMTLFLFSPIFTILCKPLVPLLSFEPTGMLFLVVSLLFCVLGSLSIGWLMNVCRVSSFFFGRKRIVSRF